MSFNLKMPKKRSADALKGSNAHIENLKAYALKSYDRLLPGLQMFSVHSVAQNTWDARTKREQGLIVDDEDKCAVCGDKEKSIVCITCVGRICSGKLCQPTKGLCCLCVQFSEYFCKCEVCGDGVICKDGIDCKEMLLKLGSLSSRGGDHPFSNQPKTCKECGKRACAGEYAKCITYKGLCIECSKSVPDIWYEKVGVKVLDASTQLVDNTAIPMPSTEGDDKTASGAPPTILTNSSHRKGPYARCCECGVRWLYDSGLADKGKPCTCVCESNEEDCTYCGGNGGVEYDWVCDREKMYSDEERHLEIQITARCCRDDFLQRSANGDCDKNDTDGYGEGKSEPVPWCNATFLVEGDITINLWYQYHGLNSPRFVCSTCAVQFQPLSCAPCDLLFEDADQLRIHNIEQHDAALALSDSDGEGDH